MSNTTTTAHQGQKEAATMATITTTTKAVRMHGWTLPKGARVIVESVRLAMPEWGQQEATATVNAPDHMPAGMIGLPVSALAGDLDGVKLYRHDAETGRDVEVDA